jgi:hypothetical protein
MEPVPSDVEVDSDVRKWQVHPSGPALVVRFKHQASGAYLNAVEASIRGHGNPPNNRHGAKASDPGTAFEVFPITQAELEADDGAAGDARRMSDAAQAAEEDALQEAEEIRLIGSGSGGGGGQCGKGWKCVISYGLYGADAKYTTGAVMRVQ